MKKYPCKLSKMGMCQYGGNKRYNYGFVSGTASYCYFAKRWITDLKECPNQQINSDPK